jgi:hypothetical protein
MSLLLQLAGSTRGLTNTFEPLKDKTPIMRSGSNETGLYERLLPEESSLSEFHDSSANKFKIQLEQHGSVEVVVNEGYQLEQHGSVEVVVDNDGYVCIYAICMYVCPHTRSSPHTYSISSP